MSLLHDQRIKYTSHVTRFADRLVENMDDLIKEATHQKIIVYLQQDVSKMMHNSCNSPNIFMSKLRDVYTQTRNTMVIQKNKFVGSCNKDSQADSVPISFMTFMRMLVDGTTAENIVLSQGALTSAQFFMYNFRKKKRANEDRQSSSCQISRNVISIDDLHALGLGISYQRILDITKNLYDSERRQYERDGVLVPCVMQKNIFTIFTT